MACKTKKLLPKYHCGNAKYIKEEDKDSARIGKKFKARTKRVKKI